MSETEDHAARYAEAMHATTCHVKVAPEFCSADGNLAWARWGEVTAALADAEQAPLREVLAEALAEILAVSKENAALLERVADLEAEVERYRTAFLRANEACSVREEAIERLHQWKAEATEVILGLQDLGEALRLPLGERITGTAAAEAAESLVARAEAAEAERATLAETLDRVRALRARWAAQLDEPRPTTGFGPVHAEMHATERALWRCSEDLRKALSASAAAQPTEGGT